jgi:hypothetical protein
VLHAVWCESRKLFQKMIAGGSWWINVWWCAHGGVRCGACGVVRGVLTVALPATVEDQARRIQAAREAPCLRTRPRPLQNLLPNPLQNPVPRLLFAPLQHLLQVREERGVAKLDSGRKGQWYYI